MYEDMVQDWDTFHVYYRQLDEYLKSERSS